MGFIRGLIVRVMGMHRLVRRDRGSPAKRRLGVPAAATALVVTLVLAGCAGRPAAGPRPASDAGPNRGAVASGANPGSAAAPSPYAGMQDRAIRALAPERVADLLAGRGAGYALAAELNHYPGPTHVLQLSGELRLSPEQERRVRDVFTAMQADAQALGRRLVDLEAELDRKFRAGEIDAAELARLTGEIAAVEGKLRNAHLAAHLKMKEILTPAQVERYDALRGYAAPAGANAPAPSPTSPAGGHGGHGQHSHQGG